MESSERVSEHEHTSNSEVVNSTVAQVAEQCSCGSSFTASMPAEYRNDLLRGVNTWRKYHSCMMRGQEQQQERSERNADAEPELEGQRPY
jgi:hypothetical protein